MTQRAQKPVKSARYVWFTKFIGVFGKNVWAC